MMQNEVSTDKNLILCACGCGNQVKLGRRFIHGHNGGHWKRGWKINVHGYILTLNNKHPFCDVDGYVRENRLVMEKHLGRYLTKDEHVHHINENKLDNRIENLQLMTKSQHAIHHNFVEDMEERSCCLCKSKTTVLAKRRVIGLRPRWLSYNNGTQFICNKCYMRQWHKTHGR